MRRRTVLFCVLLCLGMPASAEETRQLEVGTYLGMSFTFADGERSTSLGAPGAGMLLGLASLYVTTFPGPNAMFETQVHLQALSSDGDISSVLSGILQIGYLFMPRSQGSLYVAAQGGGVRVDHGNSNTMGTLGLGAGYRWEVGRGGALRLEARFRRWFGEDSSQSELGFVLGIGGLFR